MSWRLPDDTIAAPYTTTHHSVNRAAHGQIGVRRTRFNGDCNVRLNLQVQ